MNQSTHTAAGHHVSAACNDTTSSKSSTVRRATRSHQRKPRQWSTACTSTMCTNAATTTTECGCACTHSLCTVFVYKARVNHGFQEHYNSNHKIQRKRLVMSVSDVLQDVLHTMNAFQIDTRYARRLAAGRFELTL